MKTVDKLLGILEEGGKVIAGTIKRDIQKDKVTSLDERLVNYYFMRGVAVLPAPGSQLWYLDKDGEGKYSDVSSAKFVALGRDCVVMAQVEPEKLIKECEKYINCQSPVFVLPVGDVFETEKEAAEELARRQKEYGD